MKTPGNSSHRLARAGRDVNDALAFAQRARCLFLLQIHHRHQVGQRGWGCRVLKGQRSLRRRSHSRKQVQRTRPRCGSVNVCGWLTVNMPHRRCRKIAASNSGSRSLRSRVRALENSASKSVLATSAQGSLWWTAAWVARPLRTRRQPAWRPRACPSTPTPTPTHQHSHSHLHLHLHLHPHAPTLHEEGVRRCRRRRPMQPAQR